METSQRIGSLLSELLAGLTFSGWIPAALLVAVLLALLVRSPWHDRSFRRLVRAAALLPLLPLLLLLVAAIFANEDPHRAVSPIREQLVLAVFTANVVLALALIAIGKGHAWRAAAFTAVNIWVAMWSAFISTMSLTGNWP